MIMSAIVVMNHHELMIKCRWLGSPSPFSSQTLIIVQPQILVWFCMAVLKSWSFATQGTNHEENSAQACLNRITILHHDSACITIHHSPCPWHKDRHSLVSNAFQAAEDKVPEAMKTCPAKEWTPSVMARIQMEADINVRHSDRLGQGTWRGGWAECPCVY